MQKKSDTLTECSPSPIIRSNATNEWRLSHPNIKVDSITSHIIDYTCVCIVYSIYFS